MQSALFDDLPPSPGALPDGLVYAPGFLSAEEEAGLIALVRQLPLQAAQYKGYVARRRVVSYGGRFDYDSNELLPTGPLIAALHPLRDRVAAWASLAPEALVHSLVAEYAPGTPLGWHRDVPDFEDVFGVSLGGEAVLRFRPWPPDRPRREDIVRLIAAPRSVYALRGAARWAWQHSVAPVEALRQGLLTLRQGSRCGQKGRRHDANRKPDSRPARICNTACGLSDHNPKGRAVARGHSALQRWPARECGLHAAP